MFTGLDTITEGVNLYYKYYKKEDEILYKINAVKFKVFKNKKSKKKIYLKLIYLLIIKFELVLYIKNNYGNRRRH